MLCEKSVLKFKKFIYRLRMVTKTLYNLHNYIEEKKLKYVVTYKWEYNKIVNSGNF